MKVFEKTRLGNLELNHRIIRSATFEGMADQEGIPKQSYVDFYEQLAKGGAGCIIAGFVYISKQGKAMQPGQAGIDGPEKIPHFRKVTDAVHKYGTKIFLQIAHTGRQTRKNIIEGDMVAPSPSRSFYFLHKARALSYQEIKTIIGQFGDAALYAKMAGFDGIQIHAAHGYLIHQFIHPFLNRRKDEYGVDRHKRIGTRFLEEIIDCIMRKCGSDFPVLIKISGSDDFVKKFSRRQLVELAKFLDTKPIAGIEMSYGTMDYALNIFRGSSIPVNTILKHNPLYRVENPVLKRLWKMSVLPFFRLKLIPYAPLYNMEYAAVVKKNTSIPVICVGGFRNYPDMCYALEQSATPIDFVSLCRPFLCEPDFVKKIMYDQSHVSKCTNCNICAVMCDSVQETKCYRTRR